MAGLIEARLDRDLMADLGRALRTGVLVLDGYKFRLAGLPASKGPYAFFSQNIRGALPSPNWEYFVQVAEYSRLSGLYATRGYEVGFEDGLMDVSIRRRGSLIWYVEVKETAAGLALLLSRLEAIASLVPVHVPDRGNDPVRKAKYLLSHKPPFFSLVAIGERRHFAVTVPSATAFELIPLAREPELA